MLVWWSKSHKKRLKGEQQALEKINVYFGIGLFCYLIIYIYEQSEPIRTILTHFNLKCYSSKQLNNPFVTEYYWL